jgi:hypothetical protein
MAGYRHPHKVIAAEITEWALRQDLHRMPPGSCLVISHASADQATPGEVATIRQIYNKAGTPIFLRTREEITALFGGLDIVGPGVTDTYAWRNHTCRPGRTIGFGGIARKNT